MAERPELDAWLAEADAALDYDCYGRHWEADAGHYRAGTPAPGPTEDVTYRLSEQAAEDGGTRIGCYGSPPIIYSSPPRVFTAPLDEDGAPGEWQPVEAAQFTLTITREDAEAIAVWNAAFRQVAAAQAAAVEWVTDLCAALDDFGLAAGRAEEAQAEVRRLTTRLFADRRCPRHGEEMRHGQ